MSRLQERRMRFLELMEEGRISREFLKDDKLNMSHIERFKNEGLATGDLGSLQLTPNGYSILSQKNLLETTEDLNRSVEELNEAMEEFKESSEKQNQKMLSESQTMNRLTWAVLLATIVNVGLAASQVIL